MTNSKIIKATLTYDSLPEMPEDSLRTDLRVLAGKHGLPVSGTSEVDGNQLRLSCLPFEIIVELHDSALTASAFSGAISANLRGAQRTPLAKAVADHTAHATVSVRDTGESHGTREAIIPSAQSGLQDMRRSTIFAQDVLRMVMRHLEPTAVLWHPSNHLSLPGGIRNLDFGRLYLPICLRLKCTSAILADTVVVNMAQQVEGASDFLGKPLHIMALSLTRFETMQLAVAFLDRMLEGESRPISGAIFRDQRGTRMQVLDHAPSDEFPEGLIALVEIDETQPVQKTPLASSVTNARAKVATRAHARVRSRDLNRELRKSKDLNHPVVSEPQMTEVQAGLKAAPDSFENPPKDAAQKLPTVERLRELRDQAISAKQS